MSQEPTPTIAPSQPVHTIDLESITGRITGVRVYSNKAVITRTFKFNIMTGQNQLNISGLPKVLDTNSVRVQGPCSVSIYGVTISIIVPTRNPTSSDPLEKLFDEKKHIEKTCERAKKSLPSLETYLGFLKIERLDPSNLREAVKSYDMVAEELDDRIAKLENHLVETNKAISVEKTKLSESSPAVNANLNMKASIGICADSKGEIEIALIYAVQSATWNAEYDISVDTNVKGNLPVTLTYKGGITQNTGENWDNVPLTLETGTLTLRLEAPTLSPWEIGIYRQPQIAKKSIATPSTSSTWPPIRWKRGIPPNESSNQPIVQARHRDVSPRGNVGANFEVPGLVTIPSGGIIHNVTIVKLTSTTTQSLVCVPKKDTKTYLNTKIKNTSPYNFLSGQASVHVNGSFTLKSDVPLVGPEESFDCLLGVDPSIRVTYHARSKPISKSGFSHFYTNTTTYVFSRRITIDNTKLLSIENLKIIDQVPVSEDPDVTVKLVSPALGLPREGFGGGTISDTSAGSSTGSGGERKALLPSKVVSVIAQWHGADEAGVEVEALGRDGKLNWVCAVPAQEKIGLVLQWEVTVPAKTAIVGLPL